MTMFSSLCVICSDEIDPPKRKRNSAIAPVCGCGEDVCQGGAQVVDCGARVPEGWVYVCDCTSGTHYPETN